MVRGGEFLKNHPFGRVTWIYNGVISAFGVAGFCYMNSALCKIFIVGQIYICLTMLVLVSLLPGGSERGSGLPASLWNQAFGPILDRLRGEICFWIFHFWLLNVLGALESISWALMHIAFFKSGPLGTFLGPTLGESRLKAKKTKQHYNILFCSESK